MATAAVEDHWLGAIAHYRRSYQHLLQLAPAERALDVGSGEGALTRAMAKRCSEVVGVDIDRPTINRAAALGTPPNLRWVCEDVRSHYLAPGEFDLIISAATVHLLDLSEALERFSELLAPGGRLGIIGLTRPLPASPLRATTPRPPTLRATQSIAAAVLPDCSIKRRFVGHYTLTWTKPVEPVRALRSPRPIHQKLTR